MSLKNQLSSGFVLLLWLISKKLGLLQLHWLILVHRSPISRAAPAFPSAEDRWSGDPHWGHIDSQRTPLGGHAPHDKRNREGKLSRWRWSQLWNVKCCEWNSGLGWNQHLLHLLLNDLILNNSKSLVFECLWHARCSSKSLFQDWSPLHLQSQPSMWDMKVTLKFSSRGL